MRLRTWIGVVAVAVAGTGCGPGNVFSLEAGTCFDDVAELTGEEPGEIGDVPVIDCAEPHDNEVYAIFDVGGTDFPGDPAVREVADAGCLERFEDYVGRDYPSSRFVFANLVPSARSWDTADDREVVCFLYDIDLEKLEGSAQDSGE